MRCPDCNKFTGLETQEPEVNSVDIAGTTVTVDARSVRNCSECGQELKALDINADFELELARFEGWADLGEKRQEQLKEAWDAGQIEVEVEVEDEVEVEVEVEDEYAGGGDTIESGGGRYAKNILATVLPFTAKFSWEGLDFIFNGRVTREYEEQC